MRDWFRRCPNWQFVLAWQGVMVLAVVIGVSAGQWVWHHHIDPSALLGAAVGSALASAIMAVAYRQGHS